MNWERAAEMLGSSLIASIIIVALMFAFDAKDHSTCEIIGYTLGSFVALLGGDLIARLLRGRLHEDSKRKL